MREPDRAKPKETRQRGLDRAKQKEAAAGLLHEARTGLGSNLEFEFFDFYRQFEGVVFEFGVWLSQHRFLSVGSGKRNRDTRKRDNC